MGSLEEARRFGRAHGEGILDSCSNLAGRQRLGIVPRVDGTSRMGLGTGCMVRTGAGTAVIVEIFIVGEGNALRHLGFVCGESEGSAWRKERGLVGRIQIPEWTKNR